MIYFMNTLTSEGVNMKQAASEYSALEVVLIAEYVEEVTVKEQKEKPKEE